MSQIYNTEKFILEEYNKSLIKVLFTHSSIPENIDDLKVIFNESHKYEYNNETLLSKKRHILSLCHQHFLNLFSLNIKHRKAHLIHTNYIQMERLRKSKLNRNLFVINTGGNHEPLNRDYQIQKKIMKKRFIFDIIYDIKTDEEKYIKCVKLISKCIIKIYIVFFLLKLYLISFHQ